MNGRTPIRSAWTMFSSTERPRWRKESPPPIATAACCCGRADAGSPRLAAMQNILPRGGAPLTMAGMNLRHIEIFHAVYTNGSVRSEEHTSELQSLMRISYAVFCLKKKKH